SQYLILQDLFNDKISAKAAADQLAASTNLTHSSNLDCLWYMVIRCAYEFPSQQDKLVDALVQLSKLPDATENDKPIILNNEKVWKDMPYLGFAFREEWNMSVPEGPQEHRQRAICDLINRDRFAALLMVTEEPAFNYSWFALIAFREALERPIKQLDTWNPREAAIPAAAAWIEILGVAIYDWEDDWSGRVRSAPGRGGPLWKGKHGFCRERWALWRQRFGEISRGEGELGE
ncbi:hypothetical protein ASPWEDRAFT_76201, partial [Aspergillus wentii DTO 134E9]